MSGYPEEVVMSEELRLYGSHFVQKPLDLDELLLGIEAATGAE